MSNIPKVSVIMPCYNVEQYLRKCLDSVVNQTLKDIEIICVNDGSTDGSLLILNEYKEKDNRIRIIDKPNSGYGNTMNVGMDAATGEYIGIVETDDFIDTEMFTRLYEIAGKHNAQVVKSNYYMYRSQPNTQNEFFEVLRGCPYNKLISPEDVPLLFALRPCIWSAIYKRDFLYDNNIRFNETPGASYQDTSFVFQVWACAKNVFLIKDAYLHYRVDNSASSVKSAAKVFCVCDEYAVIDSFLKQHPQKIKWLAPLVAARKYENYRWNYERLAPEFQYAFLLKMSQELQEAYDAGYLQKELFKPEAWKKCLNILENRDDYFRKTAKIYREAYRVQEENSIPNELEHLKQELLETRKEIWNIRHSISFRIGRAITWLPRFLHDANS